MSQAEAIRKAAILVSSLDDATADDLLARMSDEQSAMIRRAVVAIDTIDDAEQRRVIDEFVRSGAGAQPWHSDSQSGQAVADIDGGIELDSALAHRLGFNRTSNVSPPATPAQPEAAPFGFLNSAADERLVSLLLHERPQTIALVVSHLPPERAARVVAMFDSPVQGDVLERLIELESADPVVVREVERSLESRVKELFQIERRRDAGMAAVRRILAAAEPSARRALVESLAQVDETLVPDEPPPQPPRPEIEFDDLVRLDDRALAAVLAEAGSERVVLALAGADVALVDRVLGQLPRAESQRLRKAMRRLGPTRLSDLEQAQHDVVQVMQQLAAENRIRPPAAGRLALVS